MNIKDFEKYVDMYVETKTVPEELKMFKSKNIGQGCGYKSDTKWELLKDDEVCYIPECCYTDDDGNIFDYPINTGYTKQDFINLVGKERARQLFEDVDWQTPELLSSEYDWQCDYSQRFSVLHEPNTNDYYIWDSVEDFAYGDIFGNTYHFDDYEEALERCAELNYEHANDR